MRIIDFAYLSTLEYINSMPKVKRKKYGQFFTSKETAVFMAGLFSIPSVLKRISILDPGAGSGILAIALIQRLESIPNIQEIDLTCYETDSNIIPILKSNLEEVCAQSKMAISYKIVKDNYILSQEIDYNNMFGANQEAKKFDIIIGNPPYLKIAKDAPEAKAMPDICHGAPNLYFLFAAMSLFNLADGGEMVYIIPRSWTSGSYFKQFRKRFLERGVLENIHLFISRDKVFDKESVLQETIIIKAKKTQKKPKSIKITTTQSNADFSNLTVFEAPYSMVVNTKNSYIYLITNEEEADVLQKLNHFPNTLPDIGLKMKTGLTVDFRNRESLRDYAEVNSVPLFYSQHIQNGKIVFPIGKTNEFIVAGNRSLLQRNTNYLFLKRFTAKEESRRLQCGIYLARKYPEYEEISTQNKINFICGVHELSECTIYGLYVLFNSSIYDKYYRILDGSTQVNSTEINSMPVPSLSTIERMGNELIQTKNMSETACDNILRRHL